MTCRLATALLLLAAAAGCDNSFSPKSDFRREPVVYLVLDRDRPFQILRYAASYDPPGVIPGEYRGSKDPGIDSAYVTSIYGTVSFSDTLLEAADGSLVPVMISRALHPAVNTEYRLTVHLKDGRSVSGIARVPPEPGLTLNGARSFFYFDQAASMVHLAAEAAVEVAFPPMGSYFRLWITHWKAAPGGGRDTLREEVPSYVWYTNGAKTYVYTKPDRGTDTDIPVGVLVDFVRGMVERGDTNFVDVKCTVYCLEKNFYSYLKVLKGFDDPLSVRAENPNFTNIAGGLGIFGAVVADSIRMPFPRQILEEIH